MIRFVVRRCVLTVPVLLGVATLVFSLIHLVPGDPAVAMLGEGANQRDVEALRSRLGLDRPLGEQYVAFLGGLAQGDLGESFRYGTPVTHEIPNRLWSTLQLAVPAMGVPICADVRTFDFKVR